MAGGSKGRRRGAPGSRSGMVPEVNEMHHTPTVVSSPTLTELIGGIRDVVRTHRDQAARAAAQALAALVRRVDLLDPAQCQPDPDNYRQHILHVEPDGSFSIVALVWLPGQMTPVHDHVCWCVVGVHRGQESETRYEVRTDGDDRWLVETGTGANPAGSVVALVPPGDIHRVANACGGLAVSLHVYGADIGALGTSIRRRYDLEIRPPA